VYLTTNLTVPTGVTLDLTADGAKFELHNGAVLTVDGTVNASGHGDQGKGWVEGGLRIGDGVTAINGNGTIRLQSKGCLLNIGSDKSKRHLTLDGVTLVGLEDNDQALVQVGEGGELAMKSGAITGNERIGDSGGGVNVWKSVFRMEGGEISGNTAQNGSGGEGGGVLVSGGSVFTMTGGAISGNTARLNGGGGVDIKGTFTMKGGEISSNTAKEVGGARVYMNGTFTMEGGTISANTARNEGGGVSVNESTFTMEGGTIYGKAGILPVGTDASLANSARGGASLDVYESTAKWGSGGIYTIGGVSQAGSSDIGISDETLIATPAKQVEAVSVSGSTCGRPPKSPRPPEAFFAGTGD
jgi:hypothetical protein